MGCGLEVGKLGFKDLKVFFFMYLIYLLRVYIIYNVFEVLNRKVFVI